MDILGVICSVFLFFLMDPIHHFVSCLIYKNKKVGCKYWPCKSYNKCPYVLKKGDSR